MTDVVTTGSQRRDPPPRAGEMETLLGFLQYQRDTLLGKIDGLTVAQFRAAPLPSSLSLAAILKHLALVEESWLVEDFLGQPLGEPWASVDWDADRDWEMHSAADDDPQWLVSRYREAWGVVGRIVAGASPSDESARTARIDGVAHRVSLRWILLHLIEETARHNGHADLIREALDGSTGE